MKPNTEPSSQPQPIAVIGIGCLFPEATDAKQYWGNIKNGVDAIRGIPASHWDPADYTVGDPKAPDRTYASRGGFLPTIEFDPMAFGISPNAIEATDTSQLLGLVVARQALEDAGYGDDGRPFDRSRASVCLGVTGALELVIPLGARLGHPQWRRALQEAGVAHDVAEDVVERISQSYVGWQEASFPGLLGNVVAGRIANRLDLGGTNCVVDAACASSLSAMHLSMLELESGRSDLVITGGTDTFNDIFMYMCFSKTPALSPSGNARPFDRDADGTILGEGLGIVLLKRLADAERDGDTVYAVIRGMGSSSDGKGNAIYAPDSGGQAKALGRAYDNAQTPPDTIELLEAHGTGTRVGDATELKALDAVYRKARQKGTWCALGSVKSQIGHTKAAAGAAGLIKAVLALHHKVLPPTIKVSDPVDLLRENASPFYAALEKRPWLSTPSHPRRAAVSAFGFGGSNFHCVLEEYDSAKRTVDWDEQTEIAAWSARSRDELAQALGVLETARSWQDLQRIAGESRKQFDEALPLRVALVLERATFERSSSDAGETPSEAAVADVLTEIVARARQRVAGEGDGRPQRSRDIFFGEGAPGQLGFLFPGQGSQYVGMLRDLACDFPEVHARLTHGNEVNLAAGSATLEDGGNDEGRGLSNAIYPQPRLNPSAQEQAEATLRATQVAQPAIGAVSLGAAKVLESLGVRPDAVAGHSYGELTALCVAGRLDEATFHRLSNLRGRLMAAGDGDRGTMAAVMAPLERVEEILQGATYEAVIANKNAPQQVVLSGTTEAITAACAHFEEAGIRTHRLPVAAAFHSPLVASSCEPLAVALEGVELSSGAIPVYANSTGEIYPDNAAEARALLANQLARPVEFVTLILNMYKSGVRTFVEVGPAAKLTPLVGRILEEERHLAVAIDSSQGKRAGQLDLACVFAQLAASGHPVALEAWQPRLPEAAPAGGKKPTLSVSLNGANSFQAAPPAPPRATTAPLPSARPEASTPQPLLATPAAAPTVAPLATIDIPAANLSTSAGSNQAGSVHAGPTQERSMTRPETHDPQPSYSSHSTPSNAAASHSAGDGWARLLQLTQENFVALQRMQEQSADLHRKFLESQHAAQQTFQGLIEEQQRLLRGAPAIPGAMAPAAAVSPPPVAAVPTPREVEPISAVAATPTPESTGKPRVEPPPVPTPVVVTAAAPPPPPEPEVTAASPAVEGILLEVVSEKTGYPVEVLELDMGLDADLGIDSIKRVEILSSLRENLPDAPEIQSEHLGTLETLRDIADFLGATPASTASPAATPPAGETNVAATDPTAAAAAAAESTPPNDALPGLEGILLDIVSEKTGYPVEVLELDMGLDADLGIDSIKRVEILSALRESVPAAPEVTSDHLGSLQTLRQVVEHLRGGEAGVVETPIPVVTTPPAPVTDTAPAHGPVASEAPAPSQGAPMPSHVVRLLPQPTALGERGPVSLAPRAEIWVTHDGTDLSQRIVDELGQQGYRPRLLFRTGLDSLKAPSNLGGLIVVSPLGGEARRGFLEDAFRLLQIAGSGLRYASRVGQAVFVTVSRLDGAFGFRSLTSTADPYSGGLAGLAKTASLEWPGLHAKAIDVPSDENNLPLLARRIAEETLLAGPVEVGVTVDASVTLELATAHPSEGTVPPANTSAPPLATGDVVLISGGARGITADVAVAMGAAWQPRLVLLGRSPEPKPEPEALADLETEAEIKQALLADWTVADWTLAESVDANADTEGASRPSPRELGQACARILAAREIRSTIERVRATGAHAEYRSVDVRDAARLEAVVDNVRNTLGPIRGLVHAAGVLADRKIEDKTVAQFELVLATKVGGAAALLSALEAEPLKLLAFFSSSTARFGRKGQVDYAVANEVLNKLAQREARGRTDCRVVSFNWGPWAGGMVTEALGELFRQEGIGLIPPAEGAERFVAEFNRPAGDPVEVVVLAELEGGERFATATRPSESATTDGGEKATAEPTFATCFERDLDLEGHPFLRSHVIDRKPVVPLAIIAEWLAHGAVQQNPGLVFHGFDGLRLLKGIILEDGGPYRIRVAAAKAVAEETGFRVRTELKSTNASGLEILHARADVVLVTKHPSPRRATLTIATHPYNRSRESVYSDILFHGPDFQSIRSVIGCSEAGIEADALAAPPPAEWIKNPLRGSWLADPYALDTCFQLMILWSVEQTAAGSLPCFVGRYRQFRRAFPKTGFRIVAKVTQHTTHSAIADVEFRAEDGGVLATIEGYECVIDNSLCDAFRRNQLPQEV
jgi:acyl transferase domain-containing protein/NAD(P)-dependent dehydrogenase (short-subunit alcohol dehydrogenase family)/acyl carrier protein